jgi:hypothetical protein
MLNVKNDTESLMEHRDPSSFRSFLTDKGSGLSIIFDFDEFLWTTKEYSSYIRNLIKKQVRSPPQDSTLVGKTPDEDSSKNGSTGGQLSTKRSSSSAESGKGSWAKKWQRATGDLEKLRARPRGRILLLGASSGDSATLMTLLAISCQEEHSLDKLGCYRPAIYRAVIDDVKLLLENLQGLHMELMSDLDADIFQTILQYDTSAPASHMNEHFLTTLTALWALPGLLTALEQSKGAFPENAL